MGSRDVMKLLELLNTLDKEVIEATYKNSLILKMKQLKEDIDLDKKKEAIANFVIEMFPLISFTFNDEEIKQLVIDYYTVVMFLMFLVNILFQMKLKRYIMLLKMIRRLMKKI